jgi:heme A synthase
VNKNNNKIALFRDPVLSIVLILSIVFCLFQISLGGFVRVSGSGLGCPDWPLCYGKLIPPMNYTTLIEWGHRTSGVILGTLIIISTILVWIKKRNDYLLIFTISATLITVVIVGLIGGIIVLSELDPRIRTIHLFFSQLVILLLGISLVIVNSESIFLSLIKQSVNQKHSILLILSSALIMITLLSGSYAVWKGAGTICSSWPLCESSSILPKNSLALIHMIHRVLSLITTIISLWASIYILKKFKNPIIKTLSSISIILILTQVLLGASNPWTNFEIWARVSHLGMASILWTIFIIILSLTLINNMEKTSKEKNV